MLRVLLIGTLLAPLAALAQAPQEPEEYPIGPDIRLPVPLSKPEPRYTDAARKAMIQGNVVLNFRLSSQGIPEDIEVISPLGFGLDENAIETLKSWRFQPALKQGNPVNIRATVETSFRLVGTQFDKKAEKRRTDFNKALFELRGKNQKGRQAALKTIEDLAGEKYPPAMHAHGLILLENGQTSNDRAKALLLTQESAKQEYGPALYDLGKMYLDEEPRDPGKGREMIILASQRGSLDAQYFLGESYRLGGSGYPQDTNRAQKAFRLCAAAGRVDCQHHLGELLLNMPGRRERDYTQAVAWLELASASGSAEATALVAAERPNLTADRRKSVEQIKKQLIRKN